MLNFKNISNPTTLLLLLLFIKLHFVICYLAATLSVAHPLNSGLLLISIININDFKVKVIFLAF